MVNAMFTVRRNSLRCLTDTLFAAGGTALDRLNSYLAAGYHGLRTGRWSRPAAAACWMAPLLLDGNHHGLAPFEGTEDDRPGSSGAGTDDMPFPGRLIETLTGLKSLGGAVLGGDDDRPAENEPVLAARVMVFPAPRFSSPVDQPHDKFDVACFG